MPPFQHPRLAVPPPLMMSESGSFAHLTLTQRWPAIAQRTIDENDFPTDIVIALETLLQELFEGKVRLLEDENAPDLAEWSTYLHPYLNCSWIEVPWFFAEVYFYRRLLEATQYFQPGAWQGFDPFHTQKHASLTTSLEKVRAVSSQINSLHQSQIVQSKEDVTWGTNLVVLLHNALWGNQADLSLKPTVDLIFESDVETEFKQAQKTHVLVDDTDRLLDWFGKQGKGEERWRLHPRIDLVADNAGFELICDLFLIDLLLTQPSPFTVYLHLKIHPAFVSDATIADVHHTLTVLSNDRDTSVQSLAERLRSYLAIGRLQLLADPYWVSPLELWKLPQTLHHELSQSNLVILKGDANYRRLLGDRHWSFTTRFEEIVCYFPSPLLALRTLKSEVVAGLQSEQVGLLSQIDPSWLTNGEWGVMQFADLPGLGLQ
ncbi:protein-glutamate O-methyltransferase family protein [Oculatella sp. FACHB-28]|uniref:damage-control phosphatase ARMT1 family protein n=1 Tax=Oculatella sp. FACHB-28 TaxID=2692845 RepID=UPI00168590CA|nr:damage-control phosphatase ARMT1 family protein [Oculatella sp. FACHB-28]MBD2058234.1 protein-glutamate O-methyltransferase family protein [Oculatella sp. FACHB-28]